MTVLLPQQPNGQAVSRVMSYADIVGEDGPTMHDSRQVGKVHTDFNIRFRGRQRYPKGQKHWKWSKTFMKRLPR